jgi:hypothetical protein
MIEEITTSIGFQELSKEIFVYQQATLIFCCLISVSIYLLLPKKIENSRRISASVLIFLGLFGLFSILLKTLVRILAR